MAQIGVSSSPALELRAPPLTDATLIIPPPAEPPHSFSYLLSRQDMVRYSPDSTMCPSLSDHEFEFSEFVSSPCSASDHDHSLVETISEDDRATLLPIIRIAFPSLRHSMKDPFTAWHIVADDRIMGTMDETRQPNEVEGLYHRSMYSEGSKQEDEAEALQYHFIPTLPSRIEEMPRSTGVSGIQSRDELKHPLAGADGGRMEKFEKPEAAQELMSLQRSDPGASNLADDKLSLSIASGYGGLSLLTNFPSATNSWDHVEAEASRTAWVQGQAARPVDETSQFLHEEQFGSGPSSIDSGSPHLETTSSKCSEGADQSHASQSLETSQGQTCNESERIVSSDAEEGATFGRGLDLACGSSRTNEVQKDPVTESRGVSPAAVSDVNNFKFPEVNRKRRNVIKKAVGWVRKRRTTQSFCARLSYKRKCGSACCTACELGSKKRRFSANGSHEVSLSTLFSALPEVRSDKKSKEQDEVTRKVNTIADLNCDFLEMDASPVGKESSCITPEWMDSPLSTALFLVLLESESHGVSVCEALRKLLKQGHSNLFISNSQPRAVQIKMALRRCPDFKELRSRRFVLRNCRSAEYKRRSVELASDEQCKSAAGNGGQERGMSMKGPCQNPQALGGFLEASTKKSGTASIELRWCSQEEKIEQCRKTDGKQWRCSQQAKVGFMFCEHHHQCQSRARVKGHSPGKHSHLDIQGQKLQSSHTEEESQTVADSCSGLSRERSQGDEFKLDRCRRTDGRHWQCSRQVKPGSIYCEHHQGRHKKVNAKGSVAGLFKAPRAAKRELQLDEAWAVDSAVTGVKRKAKGSVHGQIRIVRELKQGFQGSDAFALEMSPIGWNGKVKGTVNEQSAVPREMKLEQDLHVSEANDPQRPQAGAHILKGKSKGNCHGQTRIAETGKQGMPCLKMGALARHTIATHGWKGRAHHGQAAGTEEMLHHVAVDTSHSAVDSCKGKMKSNWHGQIAKERDGSRDQAVNASSSLRLSTASNGCYTAEKCGDDEGKDGSHLERCHRKDGKQWQCSKRCKPGYIYCEHHQGRRLKNKASAQAKIVNKKELDTQASTCNGGFSLFEGKALHHVWEQSQKETSQMTDDCSQIGKAELQGLKQCHRKDGKGKETSQMTDECSQIGEAELQGFKQCHRKDGKGWRCSRPVQHGFNYCEHHQVYLSKRTSPKVSKRETENHTTSNPVKIWSELLTIGCSSDI